MHREPSLFVSSGLDNCVRLFDVRKIDDRNSCIVSLSHEKGVNSANFRYIDTFVFLCYQIGKLV